jgi:hypothetical protein
MIPHNTKLVDCLSFIIIIIFYSFLLRSQLKDAIREGGVPFNRVHGSHAFEYPSLDSRFNQVFNTAMINHTTIVMKKVLECYKGFDEVKRLVDVGGGLGVNINLITSKYPHIQGINFDLPHVIENAPSYPGMKFYVLILLKDKKYHSSVSMSTVHCY